MNANETAVIGEARAWLASAIPQTTTDPALVDGALHVRLLLDVIESRSAAPPRDASLGDEIKQIAEDLHRTDLPEDVRRAHSLRLLADVQRQSDHDYTTGRLRDKYVIQKTDGSPVAPDAKHFVLRYDHDPNAQVALEHYANSLRASNPAFAEDLDDELRKAGADRWAYLDLCARQTLSACEDATGTDSAASCVILAAAARRLVHHDARCDDLPVSEAVHEAETAREAYAEIAEMLGVEPRQGAHVRIIEKQRDESKREAASLRARVSSLRLEVDRLARGDDQTRIAVAARRMTAAMGLTEVKAAQIRTYCQRKGWHAVGNMTSILFSRRDGTKDGQRGSISFQLNDDRMEYHNNVGYVIQRLALYEGRTGVEIYAEMVGLQ